jgi:transposase-like protein
MKQRHVMTALRWTEEEARQVIEVWERSGLKLKEFAEQHQFDPQRIYRWHRRLERSRSTRSPRSRSTLPTILPVKLIAREMAGDCIEIRLVNGIQVRLPFAGDIGSLSGLFELLSSC